MRWAELRPGMFVRAVAEDYFQVEAGTITEIMNTEYIFEVEGRIESITQRRMVIDGWWRWVGHADECTPDDPEITRGRFGIIRKGIDALFVLSERALVDL